MEINEKIINLLKKYKEDLENNKVTRFLYELYFEDSELFYGIGFEALEIEPLWEDDKWKIWAPENEVEEFMNYFELDNPIYILINKNNPKETYQFCPNEHLFVNKENALVLMWRFFEEEGNKGIFKFYKSKLLESFGISENDEYAELILNSDSLLSFLDGVTCGIDAKTILAILEKKESGETIDYFSDEEACEIEDLKNLSIQEKFPEQIIKLFAEFGCDGINNENWYEKICNYKYIEEGEEDYTLEILFCNAYNDMYNYTQEQKAGRDIENKFNEIYDDVKFVSDNNRLNIIIKESVDNILREIDYLNWVPEKLDDILISMWISRYGEIKVPKDGWKGYFDAYVFFDYLEFDLRKELKRRNNYRQ